MAPPGSTVPEPLTGQAVAHTFPAEPVVRLRVETQPRCTAADRARAATASKLMRAERTLRLTQAGCSFGKAIAMIIPEMTRTSAISTSVNPRRFKGASPILAPSDREDCKSSRPREESPVSATASCSGARGVPVSRRPAGRSARIARELLPPDGSGPEPWLAGRHSSEQVAGPGQGIAVAARHRHVTKGGRVWTGRHTSWFPGVLRFGVAAAVETVK